MHFMVCYSLDNIFHPYFSFLFYNYYYRLLLQLSLVLHIWQPCERVCTVCSEPVTPVSDRGVAVHAGPLASSL